MKKVWKCSNCIQMSTRLGNLKRHIRRKHGGMGKPALRYIFGNSILAPEENPSSFQIFYDEHTNEPGIKQSPKTPLVHPYSIYTRNSYSSLDKWLDNCIEALRKNNELLTRTSAMNQPLNINLPVNFPLVGYPALTFSKHSASDRVNS